MRRWLEQFEEFAIDVILERRYGKRASILRFLFGGEDHHMVRYETLSFGKA